VARPAGPGRAALLEAGSTLLAQGECTVGTLSVNAVVAQAGMSKGSFFGHFPTRRDYVVALHRSFHDAVAERVDEAVSGREPGAPRLRAGIEAYLDVCLRERTAKAWLFQARADVDLADEVAARNQAFAALAAPDLEAVGADDPAVVAHLLVAAVAEVALHESRRGRRDRRYRAAVLRLVGLEGT
jgi:AcrR family transcriptional regulator